MYLNQRQDFSTTLMTPLQEVIGAYFRIVNYTRRKFEIGMAIENLFNVKWNETQFDTESRLKDEPDPVSEIHFTPGVPFFARMKVAVFF